MCGIAGFLSNFPHCASTLTSMGNSINHRGPDDSGEWFDSQDGVYFSHRRLAILDRSNAGHQPMHSKSGRYCLIFNGEIYNHLDMRSQLSGVHWNGGSDTETLLACFDRFGVSSTISMSVGMFSFGVWDKKLLQLTLGRDRIGEKPMYYGWQGNFEKSFIFGSELKSFKNHPHFQDEINRGALSLYSTYNYIPSPYSIYKNIFKLKPGCLLTVSLQHTEPEIKSYWSAESIIHSCITNKFQGSYELINEFENLLKEVVAGQMLSDVPLGAFLSGGIDSSTIVAIMQSISSKPVKTFTIGFSEKGYNEAVYAKDVAAHLRTEHTELYVSPDDAMSVIPKLASIYDEPFSDSSQIPTFLISQLARKKVAVSLSGDGGDELFCGYNRYLLTQKIWNKISIIPEIFRTLTSNFLKSIPTRSLNLVSKKASVLLPHSIWHQNFAEKFYKGLNVLGASSEDELYLKIVSLWSDSVVLGDYCNPSTSISLAEHELKSLTIVERMMAKDILSYLPDDILTKVDRAAMAVSLETRVPFLDHRIIEFAWKLPMAMKLRNGQSKWIIRQVLKRHVPEKLFDRPKLGFSVPIGSWLRGPLREWAESLLDETRLKNEGYFNHFLIRKKWEEHISGKSDWQHHIWNILMFQSWLEFQNSSNN